MRWIVAVVAAGAVAGCWANDAGTGKGPPTPSAAPTTVSPASTCASGQWDCGWQARFHSAAALIAAQRGHIGIVLRDRRTGAVWRAGEPTLASWAGSTPKLALAVDLLERARASEITLDATAGFQLDAMLAVSDNAAADALWNRYVQSGRFLQRLRTGYGMVGATYVDGFPSRWGFIKCTATDLAALMSYLLDRLNVEDRAYLVQAMRGVGPIQRWGVWSAGEALRPGVKNGWSQELDAGRTHWITATVGFAGPEERYVVAAMYHQLPGGDTIDHGVHVLSDLVATVFGAPVPAVVVVPTPATPRWDYSSWPSPDPTRCAQTTPTPRWNSPTTRCPGGTRSAACNPNPNPNPHQPNPNPNPHHASQPPSVSTTLHRRSTPTRKSRSDPKCRGSSLESASWTCDAGLPALGRAIGLVSAG